MEPRTLVTFDMQANKAVRENNAQVVLLEEDVPTQGGNIDKFREIAGDDDRKCEEYTMCQYMGDSAKEFIAIELIRDWNRKDEDQAKKSPVLEEMTGKVGVSNKAHKKTKNLIQVLYIHNKINSLD